MEIYDCLVYINANYIYAIKMENEMCRPRIPRHDDVHTSSAIWFSLFLSGPLLEFHFTEVQDGSCALVDAVLLFSSETQHVKSVLDVKKANSKSKTPFSCQCFFIDIFV